jgi:hypothetical protein
LLELRRERPALQLLDPGATRTQAFEAERALVVTRAAGGDAIALVLGFGTEAANVNVELPAGPWAVLVDSHPETRALAPFVTVNGELTPIAVPAASVLLPAGLPVTSTPVSTYRLQLHADFAFAAARAVVPYLTDLGVDWLYLSPVFTARLGSRHGYDVVDPTEVNPELGGRAGLEAFADDAHAAGLGVLLDIVPNHQAVATETRGGTRRCATVASRRPRRGSTSTGRATTSWPRARCCGRSSGEPAAELADGSCTPTPASCTTSTKHCPG